VQWPLLAAEIPVRPVLLSFEVNLTLAATLNEIGRISLNTFPLAKQRRPCGAPHTKNPQN
jgi:hypothetical protein